jgi:hypothetical protein
MAPASACGEPETFARFGAQAWLHAAVRRQGVDWMWRPVRGVEPSEL